MRLSRGRSTPTRRAITWPFLEELGSSVRQRWFRTCGATDVVRAPATAPEVGSSPEKVTSHHVVGVQLWLSGSLASKLASGDTPTGSPDSVRPSRAVLSLAAACGAGSR